MTLFKQIAILLSLFLLIILGTVLTLNFKSANESISQRLYEDAKNTASSLSLSLGGANGDISMMTTMINANFDSGNYLLISLVDVDDAILYERVLESSYADVPAWFLELITLEAPIASANVSAGWNQVGILHVQSDLSYAYTELYSILKNLLISFSILVIIALGFLNLLLAAVLKPLKEVQKQAEAVIRNEFIIQKHIPSTKEFQDVVLGMNTMVSKVKVMFDIGNKELQQLKELEYIDPATKLKNRKYLIDKFPEYLKIDAVSKDGINMMLALSGITKANEQIGHEEVDALFVNLAKIFTDSVQVYNEAIVARMNGTEFAIFIPNCGEEEAKEIAKNIKSASQNVIEAHKLDIKCTFISIGIFEYNYRQNISKLLSLSDNALTQAKFCNSHIHYERAQNATEVMGKNAWRTIITEALGKDALSFVPYKVVNAGAKKVAHYALSLTLSSGEKRYSYGQFMAPANQLGLSNKVYQNVLNMLFKKTDPKLKNTTCSLRLSYEYLQETQSYHELSLLLKQYGMKLPLRLIIEMPDKFVRKNTKDIQEYKALFEKYKVDMGIYEFIGESQNYQYLQELLPLYIKAEANYFLTQNTQSLSALKLVTDSVGIILIASSVMDKETLEKLEEIDIHTIQGKVSEEITFND
ncbi:MAG: LapD/MoxY N-terminal periplasmic domain-containing protein [Sulfurimonas sp.]|nr:LapD/MoxY N-terminal periplasmic domain-containing protein [Sulfurimonas sp.]MDD3059364.1 LapD/MoxY N-terminal periplasmic domain-containing protein [Sulfurimonas sp.]MDD5201593.1 LapD/MoxY N-terminal periplasmic domain-containing protein [Sulfurimonas sp.]